MSILPMLSRCAFAMCIVATCVVVSGCADRSPAGADPLLPSTSPIPAQYRGAAFIMDVSAVKRTVKISAPGTGITGAISTNGLSPSGGTGPSYSLLGGDVVDLRTSNFQAGALGASVPGKVLVTFDLTINNRLNDVRLVTPTFPTPPSGVEGVQVFPFEISVITTAGGVTSNGNEIAVASPRFGAVTPSDNWNGSFHNFFNDAACAVNDNDCFRYESFGSIAPLGSSTTQQVGFLIDPTVGDFRVKVLLAADIEPLQSTTGGVVGIVTSPQIGPISGAIVSVTGGFAATTNAGGTFAITGIPTGMHSASVTNLPTGCIEPASVSFTASNSNLSNALNIVVMCAVPFSITGAITSSLGGPLPGIGVSATPAGGVATAVATTASGTGVFRIAFVPTVSANGMLTLSNVPSNCTNPGPLPYTGFSLAGLIIQNIVLTCAPTPRGYPVSLIYSPILNSGPTGRQVRMTVRWDADTLRVVGLAFQFRFNGQALTLNSRRLESTFEFGAHNVFDMVLRAAYGAITPNFDTGAFNVVSFLFDITVGYSGSVTPTLTVEEPLYLSQGLIRVIDLSLVPITQPGPIIIP